MLKRLIYSFLKNKERSLQKEINILSEKLICSLIEKKYTITTSESCTGGMISSYITSVSGSSECFNGSFVTYSNEMKMKVLSVSENTLTKYGAVSEQCVKEMSLGALFNAASDIAISVSGIAGPLGGSEHKPVGSVWVCIAFKKNILGDKYSNIDGISVSSENIFRENIVYITKLFLFKGNREEVRLYTTLNVFKIVLSIL